MNRTMVLILWVSSLLTGTLAYGGKQTGNSSRSSGLGSNSKGALPKTKGTKVCKAALTGASAPLETKGSSGFAGSSVKSVAPKKSPSPEELLKKWKALRAELGDILKGPRGAKRELLRDYINYFNLQYAIVPTENAQSLTILAGNSFSLDKNLIARAKELVDFALKTKRMIIYDGDSLLAPYIGKAAGDYGLAVISGSLPSKMSKFRFVRIQNPYLRMKALAAPKEVAWATGDSALGLGLTLNNMVTHHSTEYTDGGEVLSFSELNPSFSDNHGLRLRDVPWMSLDTAKDLSPIELLSDEQLLDELSSSDFKALLASLESYSRGQKILRDKFKNSGNQAVVFGSGGFPTPFTQTVYRTVKELAEKGVAVSTGGAGGVMQIANQAAYDAGADSVGVGLGGKLASEQTTFTDIQTLTLNVRGYEERIPLLLDGKKLVLIAPGGMGTMKEVATLIVKMSAKKAQDHVAVFVGRDYYERLFSVIRSALPEPLKSRFYLVDDELEFQGFLTDLQENDWFGEGYDSVIPGTAPEPRNNNTKFKVPKSKYGFGFNSSETTSSDGGGFFDLLKFFD